MAVRARARRWILAIAMVTALAISLRAISPWTSTTALGDVAVSFENEVLIFNDTDLNDTVDTINSGLSGINGALQFDESLNLLVTNAAFGSGTGSIKSIAPIGDPHAVTTFASAPDNVQAITIAADDTVYVASPGNPVTIRRYGASPATFLVNVDSTACVGIDLAPDGATLYLAAGGRNIYTVTNANTVPSSTQAITVPVWTTLSGGGTACGLRLLAPVDIRAGGTSEIHGGLVVADGNSVKRLSATKQLVDTFDAGAGNKDWIDVALDPDLVDFYAVDAGSWRLAKFRMSGTPKIQAVKDLTAQPHGVAVNGELRAALTVRLATLATQVIEGTGLQAITLYQGTATFLEGTSWQSTWTGRSTTNGMTIAIQAFEVRDDPTVAPPAPPTACSPSLDIECRLQNFQAATAKAYSHDRSVVYREILRPNPGSPTLYRIGITYPNETYTAGETCTPSGTPGAATALLRDPWQHDVFSLDLTLALYGGDDGTWTKTLSSNDSILVNRGDAVNFLRIIKPMQGATIQLGRSLPIAVEVRNPTSNCSFVTGLENTLVLTVTDVSGSNAGTIIGDSLGLNSTFGSNGITWATTASQYRTNLAVDPPEFSATPAPSVYRMCITAAGSPPIAPQACRDFTVSQ
jgi:hypothetical protein